MPVSVLKLEGPLFFGTIESLKKTYSKALNHEILVIDMSHVTMIDLSGVFALEDLINSAKAKNIKILVSSANSSIKNVLEKLDFIKHLGKDCYKDSKQDIMAMIFKNQY